MADIDTIDVDESRASSPAPTSSDEEDDEPIDSLIQGRGKRSTAGRHMSALLDAEGDDDLALLFEEVDDDNEFSGEEDADEDLRMDDSSDDEDQGPDAKDDEDEGEKELQKEARAERKKRKTQDDLRLKALRKKVKIDPTAVSAVPGPPPRPKKKSERISWLPTQDEGPTRSSSRRQTMQNKEITHARLKDSEEKRVRLIATMEKAAERKAQFKPKERTQAEWLAEAERMERLNSKSLNRWEETEKRKADERRMKIEALQNRRLEGPVMSNWSGIATWVNGRLARVGKVDIKSRPKIDKEEAARRKIKKMENLETPVKATSGQPETAKPDQIPPGSGQVNPAPSQQDGMPPGIGVAGPAPLEKESAATLPVPAASAESGTAVPADAQLTVPEAPKQETIQETKSVETTTATEGQTPKAPVQEPDPEPNEQEQQQTPENGTEPAGETQGTIAARDAVPQVSPVPAESKTPAPISMPPQPTQPVSEVSPSQQLQGDTTPSAPGNLPEQSVTEHPTRPPLEIPPGPAMSDPAQPPDVTPDQPVIPDPTQPPPVIERTGRNVTILEDFDDRTAHSKEFSIYFNAKKPPRLSKISSSLCVITSLPARYRDPDTSLPYANSYAWREIQRMKTQNHAWSTMLGCYVAPVGLAANGVPKRFLDPDAEVPVSGNGGEGDSAREPGVNTPNNDVKGETNATVPPTPSPAPGSSAPVTGTGPATGGDAMDVDQ